MSPEVARADVSRCRQSSPLSGVKRTDSGMALRPVRDPERTVHSVPLS